MKEILFGAILAVATISTAHAGSKPETAASISSDESAKPRQSPLQMNSSADMLSDDFMRDVSDGSKPSADGKNEEEESGETIDQSLRTHATRLPN